MIKEELSFDVLNPQPLVIIISGLAGAGKDSVVKSLMQQDIPLHFVITSTTRSPRGGEVHGKDYFFYSREEFIDLIEQDAFIEVSKVYDDYKGIPREQVVKALITGKDMIFRVDVQGTGKLKKIFPEAVTIFLIPDNFDEWYRRLCNRKTESASTLKTRVETAREEMKHIQEFDYIVKNADNCLNDAVDTIVSIIAAEHHRTDHRRVSL
jgi:guanylate kinase